MSLSHLQRYCKQLLPFFLLLFLSPACKKDLLNKNSSCLSNPPKNVLLITIDTLRADHLGCYGYSHIKTPNIDSLAKEGVLFDSAFTPVPITLPSHASILTSLYPRTHGILNNGEYKLNEEIETLTQILQKNNFTTAAFVGAFVLNKQFGLSRGFDLYNDKLADNGKMTEAFSLYNERRAEKVNKSAFEWLKKQSDGFFLWVHYFDPHTPYDPPLPFRDEYGDHLYDGEIAYVDQCIGLLFAELEKNELWQNTLIILVADHGESLGEHKENTHGIFLYDATIRVPLIIKSPGIDKGKVCSTSVKTIDIAPTILDIVCIPIPEKWQGESLKKCLYHENSSFPETPIFLETRFPEANFGWSRLEGVRTNNWKYIQAPRPELYNLNKDPEELSNVINQFPKQANKLTALFSSFIDTHPEPDSQETPMDPMTQKRLQSLGYVTAPSFSKSANLCQDPKDMIDIIHLYDLGSLQYEKGHFQEAIDLFRQVLQKNPQNILTRFLLGNALEKTGQLEESLKEFQKVNGQNSYFINIHNNIGNLFEKIGDYEKAIHEYQTDITLHPETTLSYNNLGVIYLKKFRYQEAKDLFEKVLTLNPDRNTQIITHTNLGIAYEMLNIYKKALKEYDASLKLDPTYQAALLGAGNVYYKTQKFELAIEEWEKVLKINPLHSEAHFNLGCIFLKKENPADALFHLQQTIRLEPTHWQARQLIQTIRQKSTSP